jgi:Uma2 family endonuclease
MLTKNRATIEDLYKEKGKAELVNGELVKMGPTGAGPGRKGGKIFARLLAHEEEHGGGYAFPDNVGFLVSLPNRESFSPDAAWYTGSLDENDLNFVQGAPAFAVEVRSKGDYGPKAERAIAEKIADYFAAGTQVVWDVDLRGTDVITKYTAPDVSEPFRRGDIADAEPAVPGWTMPVDALFR